MAKMQVTVCDRCANVLRSTKRYRITSDGRSAQVDLCEEHGTDLEELLESGGRAPGVNSFESHVSSLEAIEELKRSRGRKG